MNFYYPNNLKELFSEMKKTNEKKYFLAGGTDINVQIKNGIIKEGNIFYINHLDEINGIKEVNDEIFIGATTGYQTILDSDILKDNLPLLTESLTNFASPLLTTMATIGGNIANGSPTADGIPILLVLDAEIELISDNNSRRIPLNEFFTGYKKFAKQDDEIIKGIWINKTAEKDFSSFYKKVGARKTLTIAKIAFAGLKKIDNGKIDDIKIAVGSLNEYARRLPALEIFLKNKNITEINMDEMIKTLKSEITPISDLRSDKEYRLQVCINLLKSFIIDETR